METSAVIAILPQGLAFQKHLQLRNSVVVAIAAIDSISPPVTVRSDPVRRTVPRAMVRRTRRKRRRSLKDDDGGEDEGFSGDGDGDDGPFGGGGGGGGGGGIGGGGGGGGKDSGFGGSGLPDWEGEPSDPAFAFVYEVLSFGALSNCAHFAYKRIGRFLTSREEKVVPVTLVEPIC